MKHSHPYHCFFLLWVIVIQDQLLICGHLATTLYCEDVTATDSGNMIRNVTGKPATRGSTVNMTEESTFTTQSSIKRSNSSTTSDKIIIISGAVVFPLLLLIILLVVLTFVVKKRRKSPSMNVIDPIEMTTQPQMLHNPPSESIMVANQASTTQEIKQDKAVDYIEISTNHAGLWHRYSSN